MFSLQQKRLFSSLDCLKVSSRPRPRLAPPHAPLAQYACNTVVAANTAGLVARLRKGGKLNDGVVGALGCVAALATLTRLWKQKVRPATPPGKQ